jgi:hypothetical protein
MELLEVGVGVLREAVQIANLSPKSPLYEVERGLPTG